MGSKIDEWHPASWRTKPAQQQPNYEDQTALDNAIKKLQEFPPLVHIAEVELLKTELARVARGEKFLLQGGDCAERFEDAKQKTIEDKIKILLQMSLVITYVGHKPVVRVGRMAGQYAKPRSSDTELVAGKSYPSFRGDSVNSFENLDQRKADPERLIQAYFHSTTILNYTRAVLAGGFGNLRKPEIWDFEFVKDQALQQEYKTICENILDSLHFFDTLESTSGMPESTLRGVNLYTSHEALLLPYEEALTRPSANYGVPTTGKYKYYNSSAHFLWVGDRTRKLDGAHIEYLSGLANPIGIKSGPSMKPEEIVELIKKLNPHNEIGKITVITRCGANEVDTVLPPIIEAVKKSGLSVVWSCDPMHGNTKTVNGYKTRNYDDVFKEVEKSFHIHDRAGTILGGVHLEMTGENVTECLGGSGEIQHDHLHQRYETACDPRLNYTQSLDIAFAIAKHQKDKRTKAESLLTKAR